MDARTRLVLTQSAGVRRGVRRCSPPRCNHQTLPTADVIAQAIGFARQRSGARGCAEAMAQEFGDHLDAAAERMRWARRLAA